MPSAASARMGLNAKKRRLCCAVVWEAEKGTWLQNAAPPPPSVCFAGEEGLGKANYHLKLQTSGREGGKSSTASLSCGQHEPAASLWQNHWIFQPRLPLILPRRMGPNVHRSSLQGPSLIKTVHQGLRFSSCKHSAISKSCIIQTPET